MGSPDFGRTLSGESAEVGRTFGREPRVGPVNQPGSHRCPKVMSLRDLVTRRAVARWERVEYGRCGRCGHEIVLARPITLHGWAHHITRSQRSGVPHWPAGHVLTTRCLRERCECSEPSPNLDFPVKKRLIYVGSNPDPFRE